MTEKLSRWLETLEISVRTHNVLLQSPWDTPQEVINASDDDLLRLPGFGRSSLRDLRDALEYAFRPQRAAEPTAKPDGSAEVRCIFWADLAIRLQVDNTALKMEIAELKAKIVMLEEELAQS